MIVVLLDLVTDNFVIVLYDCPYNYMELDLFKLDLRGQIV